MLSDCAAEHFFCGIKGAYCNGASIIDAYVNFISTKKDLQMEYLLSLTLPIGPSDMKGLAVKNWLALADGGSVQNKPDSYFLPMKPFTQKVKQNPAPAAGTPKSYTPLTSSQEH